MGTRGSSARETQGAPSTRTTRAAFWTAARKLDEPACFAKATGAPAGAIAAGRNSLSAAFGRLSKRCRANQRRRGCVFALRPGPLVPAKAGALRCEGHGDRRAIVFPSWRNKYHRGRTIGFGELRFSRVASGFFRNGGDTERADQRKLYECGARTNERRIAWTHQSSRLSAAAAPALRTTF